MRDDATYIRKVTVTGERGTYYVTFPMKIIRDLNWRKGTILSVCQKGKAVVIKKWEKG